MSCFLGPPQPEVSGQQTLAGIEEAKTSGDDKLKVLGSENEKIAKQFREQGLSGDVTTLLGKVEEYQKHLEYSSQRLKKIDEMSAKKKDVFTKIAALADSLDMELKTRVLEIQKSWQALKTGKEGWSPEQIDLNASLLKDIEISGEVSFDEKSFKSTLSECFNRTKFRATKSESTEDRIKQLLTIKSPEDYLKLLRNETVLTSPTGEMISLEEFLALDIFSRNGEAEFIRSVVTKDNRMKFIQVVCQIKYLGKLPKQLSIGQRGTLYLCLKLATDTFGTPFIFDQPEDDLDNSFIAENLVPLIRKIKKYRQVIFATHNANVVVNSDCEQIIVANNEGEMLSYVSGAIENTFTDSDPSDLLLKMGIREHVCRVLEGGKDAFKKREKKYQF
ncbi:MAG: hypothetical protein R3B45_01295 [Bdellovibrionota bacterium]